MRDKKNSIEGYFIINVFFILMLIIRKFELKRLFVDQPQLFGINVLWVTRLS